MFSSISKRFKKQTSKYTGLSTSEIFTDRNYELALYTDHSNDKYFTCPSCKKNHSNIKHSHNIICECGFVFARYGNILYLKKEGFNYNPTRLNTYSPYFTPYPPNGYAEIFRDYRNDIENDLLIKTLVSSHNSSNRVQSQAIPDLLVREHEHFICPVCKIVMDCSPKHGEYFQCECETPFISFGNSLVYVFDPRVKIQHNLLNFD